MNTEKAKLIGIEMLTSDSIINIKEKIESIVNSNIENNDYYCFIDSSFELGIRKFDNNNLEKILNDFNQLRIFSTNKEIKISSNKSLKFSGFDCQDSISIEYDVQIIEHSKVKHDDKRISKQLLTSKSSKSDERILTLVQYIYDGNITEPIMLSVEEVE